MSPDGEVLDPDFDELMLQLVALLPPTAGIVESTLQLSTGEVFERLQRHYSSPTYTADSVFKALKQLGYVQHDPYRTMEFVWLFR